MLHTGLLSITFRSLAPDEIVRLTAETGLEGIEWGGDVHVPPGNVNIARDVARLTLEAGLRVSAYGSYYRAGVSNADEFMRVRDSAVMLGAPIIRVWAGNKGSKDATDDDRKHVADDLRRISELAANVDIKIATEWHGHTLTNDSTSAQSLFDAVDHPNLFTYWQPPQRMAPADCASDLEVAFPRLTGVHVFEWDLESAERKPLADGESHWPAYLRRAAQRGPMFASLEFVRADSPEQLKPDAEVLKRWVAAIRM